MVRKRDFARLASLTSRLSTLVAKNLEVLGGAVKSQQDQLAEAQQHIQLLERRLQIAELTLKRFDELPHRLKAAR